MSKPNINYIPFLVFAAICSFAGALTTALLIFLPDPVAADFEAQALLHNNNLYISKLWILFIHPQVNLLSCLGVAWLLIRKYPLRIIAGTFFLLVWAITEMSQQSFLIDTLNQLWRPEYIAADTEASRSMLKTLILAANGISDSQYFMVIYGFGLGSLLFGLAFIQESHPAKWLGAALIFIGLLSLVSFARYYAGLPVLDAAADWSYRWIYPYLQPLVRIAIGLWIITKIRMLIRTKTDAEINK